MKKIFILLSLFFVALFATGCTIFYDDSNSTPYFTESTITEKDVDVEPSLPLIEEVVVKDLAPKVGILNKGNLKLNTYNSKYSIPENLSSELYNIVDQYNELDIGIYAISLYDNTCIGFNESYSIHTASTVKAPFALYVVKEIANGNHSFDEKIEYKEKFYNSGSGDIKKHPYGTLFTVEELLYNMIHVSDNIAFLMLQDHFGYEGYNEMVKSLGCTVWLNGYTKWGFFTAEELAIIWNEIYEFSKVSKEGEHLLTLLINAEYNFTKDKLNRYSKVAHKSGFNPDAYNDAAIIFSESDIEPQLGKSNDYILVIMTTPGNSGYNSICLQEIAKQMDLIMRDLYNYQKGSVLNY